MTPPTIQADCPLNPLKLASSPPGEWKASKIGRRLQSLARAGIAEDTFYQEDGANRFDSLAACSPAQLSVFSDLQQVVAEQVSKLSTESLVLRLQKLYDRAYAYDAAAGTMDVTNQAAKDELDLWIAAIEYQAYNDSEFLARINVPEINRIIGLDSPHLSPHHRASIYRTDQGLSTYQDEQIIRAREQFEWLRHYDGTTASFETPHFRSIIESNYIGIATHGRERFEELSLEAYPADEIYDLLQEYGLVEDFERLAQLTDEQLIYRNQAISDLIIADNPSPRDNQAIAREILLIGAVLQSRGKSLEAETRAIHRQLLVDEMGFTPEAAHLLSEQDSVHLTHGRLDDYQVRDLFLGQFRELYRDFLTTPIEERFSPERSHRYNLWGQFISNQAVTGVSLRLEDIDRVRDEVQAEIPPETDGPMTLDLLTESPAPGALWLRPEDLGLTDDVLTNPFAVAAQIHVADRTLAEFVQENVEHIAILPPEMIPSEHVLGLSYALFGAIVISGQNADRPWTTGSFLRVLGHEAGHNHFARANFDTHPELLLRHAVNERYARLIGMQVGDEYLAITPWDPDTSPEVQVAVTDSYLVVEVANRQMGLEDSNEDLLFDHPSWQDQPLSFFMFQPEQLVRADPMLIPREVLESISAEDKSLLWANFVVRSILQLEISMPDTAQIVEALKALDKLQDGELYRTFEPSHPINRLLSRGRPPGPLVLTQASWARLRDIGIVSEAIAITNEEASP